jgi:DNA-binding LacI/PurR family transcriptional regulator
MSIEAIDYIVDGVLVRRTINGQEQDLSDMEMQDLPFVIIKQTMTREEFDAVWGDNRKKKKRK